MEGRPEIRLQLQSFQSLWDEDMAMKSSQMEAIGLNLQNPDSLFQSTKEILIANGEESVLVSVLKQLLLIAKEPVERRR
jgi:hypothetical protein